MKNVALGLALASAMMSLPASADSVAGLYAGAQVWQMETDGAFGSNDSSATFDYQDETQGVYYVALEHPLFILPNLKLRYNDVTTGGDTRLSGEFTFGGETYSANTTVTTDVDLTHTDIILYYELFDNDIVSVDLGLNVKYLDGEITVVDENGRRSHEELRAPVPLGYLKAELGLPLTGLSTFGEVNYLTLGGHTLSDYQLGVAYQLVDNLAVDMNIHAGYREIHFELDDLDDVDADLDFSGAFAGVEVHF